MKNLFLCIAAILMILGQSCSSSKRKAIEKEDVKASIKYTQPVIAADVAFKSVAPSESTTDRKLTKEATISFETDDYKNTCSAIKNLITKYKGQINTESDNVKVNKDLEANFNVRIPAKSFDLFLGELESVDGKIVNKEINIEDITADYIDIETRLKAKKELETRYTQLLAKATKVTEMLEIEQQLGDQREEIESMEGRFKFMQHEVANNLLRITVTETKTATSGFFGKAFHSLGMGWTAFVQFLQFLLILWPFAIVGCGIWYLIRRNNRIKKEKLKSIS
jgi:hypothetical protein